MPYQTIATRRTLRARRVVTRAAALLEQHAEALRTGNAADAPAGSLSSPSATEEMRAAARDLRTLI